MNSGLQNGMLAYYLEQAKASDVNVEARIEREPFDWRGNLKDEYKETIKELLRLQRARERIQK